jgi:hypothetical protein
MNPRIGVALLIVAAIVLGWLLKTQIDVNRQQMNEIRDLRAELAVRITFEKASEIQRPSAEVFGLRSECADLGKRILDDSFVGSALTQDQVSHYDPRTSRCYVELIVQTADSTKAFDYLNRKLFDGQTKELLAFARIQKESRYGVR